ncbi:MAG: DNA polymerase III subunit delta [Candidatus Hydrogenedentota bacterium]
MDINQLLHNPDPAALPPVLLFCPGKQPRARAATFEPILAEHAVEAIANAAIDPSLRDMAYSVFYADETQAAEIVMEAQTLPFLAERRVLVVRNAEVYKFESHIAPLLKYLESPADTTLMLIVAGAIDRRQKFFKLCQKAGEIVECPELNTREAEAWVREDAQRRGKQIDSAAVRELVRRAGTRLGDVKNALGVVATYVGGEEQIHEADVAAACSDVAEEEVWTLTDAIAKSDMAKALQSLRKLLDLGKHPDEIMGTINWLLKSAYVSVAPESGEKLSQFVAEKVRPLAAKLGRAKLRDAFALCTDTQFMMRSTGVNATLAMELLVVKLAAPRKRAAGQATARR